MTSASKKYIPFLFAGPAIILLLIFKILPIINCIVGSLFESRAGGQNVFVGLANYKELFSNPVFYKSLWATIRFNIWVNPIQILLALLFALLFNQKVRGMRVFRTIYYIPVCVSLVIATIMWSIMLNPHQGIVNSFLALFGIPSQPFFTSTKQAMWCVIIIATWKGFSYWMMFILAGLQGIPESVYESARIDGSSTLNTIIKITIPLLHRTLAFVIISDTIINLLLFSPMYIQTDGGPQMSTNVMMYEAFKSAYSYLNMGRSYAIITILLAVIIAIVSVQAKLLKLND